jgi:hypothetical protein
LTIIELSATFCSAVRKLDSILFLNQRKVDTENDSCKDVLKIVDNNNIVVEMNFATQPQE